MTTASRYCQFLGWLFMIKWPYLDRKRFDICNCSTHATVLRRLSCSYRGLIGCRIRIYWASRGGMGAGHPFLANGHHTRFCMMASRTPLTTVAAMQVLHKKRWLPRWHFRQRPITFRHKLVQRMSIYAHTEHNKKVMKLKYWYPAGRECDHIQLLRDSSITATQNLCFLSRIALKIAALHENCLATATPPLLSTSPHLHSLSLKEKNMFYSVLSRTGPFDPISEVAHDSQT